MLNNIDEEFGLELSTNRAGILRPVNNENEHEDILMLVMPFMLSCYLTVYFFVFTTDISVCLSTIVLYTIC